jgi:hypothetical protein
MRLPVLVGFFFFLGLFMAAPASAYNQYTAGYSGITTYYRPSVYPAVMGIRGIYAGGNYPHFYVQSGDLVQKLQRLNYVTHADVQFDNRYSRQTPYNQRLTYSRNYYTTNMPAQNLRDWRYPPTYYRDRGTWSFPLSGSGVSWSVARYI